MISISTTLTQLIKQASKDEREASKPADAVIGTVVSDSPLKIKISQKLILTEDFLVLTRNVTDYQTTINIDGGFSPGTHSQYEGSGAHTHTVTGGTITIFNHLQTGDKVLMLRESGGQKFYVLDRVV